MATQHNMKPDPHKPNIYQIRLAGHLGAEWTEWFEGLSIRLEANGDTLLTGLVADQAALYGLLKKARDLGMTLISVNCLNPGQVDGTDTTG